MHTLSSPQYKIFEQLMQGKNVFIVGDANTGKTYLVKYYLKWLESKGSDLSKVLFVDDIPYLNDEVLDKIKSFEGQKIITSRYHSYLFGCYNKKKYTIHNGIKIVNKKTKTICAKSLVEGELCEGCIAELKYLDRQDDIIYQKHFGIFDTVVVLKRPIRRNKKSNNDYCLYDNRHNYHIVCSG